MIAPAPIPDEVRVRSTRADDPIPAELHDRIMGAREAVSTAARMRSSDLHRYWRAVAAARRRLAAAYQAAYEIAPTGTVLSVALLDACAAQRYGAHDDENRAGQIRHPGAPTAVGRRA